LTLWLAKLAQRFADRKDLLQGTAVKLTFSVPSALRARQPLNSSISQMEQQELLICRLRNVFCAKKEMQNEQI